MLDAFKTGGASPPSPRAEAPNEKPTTAADHAVPTDEAELHALRDRMRAALIRSFLWRECAATRYDDERTLVTRRPRRRR